MAPRPMAVHPVHGYKIKPQEDLKTIKRNTRERNRVQTVNSGFDTLKQHLPGTAHLKKVSKVTILTHAMEYIAYLTRVLNTQQPRLVFSQFSQQRAMEHQHQMLPNNQQNNVQLTSYTRRQEVTSDFYSDSDPMHSPMHSMHSPMQPMHSPMQSMHSPMPIQASPMHPRMHATMHSPAHPMHSPVHMLPSPAQNMHSPAIHSPAPASSTWDPSVCDLPPPPPLVSSTSSTYDDVSSGEEDDILDAIAEWQQVA